MSYTCMSPRHCPWSVQAEPSINNLEKCHAMGAILTSVLLSLKVKKSHFLRVSVLLSWLSTVANS